ncbi:MAG: tRNA pseudouridine(38-40) synthase TruA, partial [Bacteroidota bacterium]
WTFPAPGQAYLTLEANRFLRNMVRAVVGTLIEVGRGYRPADLMEPLIQEANRSAAGTSAPAHGLYLEQVEYPQGLLDQPIFGVAPPLLHP